MSERGDAPSAASLHEAAARRGIVLPAEDFAAAPSQLQDLIRALNELERLGIASLEPTTYARFDG